MRKFRNRRGMILEGHQGVWGDQARGRRRGLAFKPTRDAEAGR